MNYSHIFSSFVPKTEKLESFGFVEADETETAGSGKILRCKKPLPLSAFYAEFTLNLEKSLLESHVFDSETGERYALFDVPGAQGTFVGEIREEVQRLIDEFCKTCCVSADLRNDYFAFIERRFAVKPEFPWASEAKSARTGAANAKSGANTEAYADAAVFRCPNGKWFALAMDITYRQMQSGLKAVDAEKAAAPASAAPGTASSSCENSGKAAAVPFSAEDKVWCVNLKAAPDEIPLLIDAKSIFPAYHMNKKHWITVALTAATDFDKLCDLTGRSFELVAGKGSRK